MARRAIVDQPLQMAGRGWRHTIDQAIGRDVAKALVELILNSDDSYRQLERRGRKTSGLIEIGVQRRKKSPSTIVVRDEAAGMSPRGLDKFAGVFGLATADRSVRGFFGRGLKEAILGLGSGKILSTKDGYTAECALAWDAEEPRYRRYKEKQTNAGPGTEIGIEIDRTDAEVRVPLHDNLVESLQRYFSLRDVLQNPKRKIVVTDVPRNRSNILSYSEPVAEVLIDAERVEVPGYSASYVLTLKRAEDPLLTPAEEGGLAPGGLLIVSPNKGILALTLLKYSNNSDADHLFGRVECADLDPFILNDEPILRPTREVDGILWPHPFARALKASIEEKLKPFVDLEARRRKAAGGIHADPELQRRLSAALRELNAIAQGEIGASGSVREPQAPENGFGFIPDYVQVIAHREAALYLRSLTPSIVPSGSQITLTCDNACLELVTPRVAIEDDLEHEGLGRAKVLVKGNMVGGEALVTATLRDGLSALASVRVISKRKEPPDDPKPKPPRGLFEDVKADPEADPRQRSFVRDKIIWIATRAPTVSRYIGPNFEGAKDTSEGQLLVAELVAEAFCREVASERVRRNKFVYPWGGAADAREREYRRLHNEYALRIHELLFPMEVRRGRPTATQMADEAVVAQ